MQTLVEGGMRAGGMAVQVPQRHTFPLVVQAQTERRLIMIKVRTNMYQ
jgi:hypothetical protein